MDICDFFPSVNRSLLAGLIREDVIDDCLLDGAPQPGLPTSPLVASIALTTCDRRIVRTLLAIGVPCVYTRYADDLVFSFDDIRCAPKIAVVVNQILEKSGFQINRKKTRLQSASNGRVIINGIGVDQNGIHATRKTKGSFEPLFIKQTCALLEA
jgi:RNA-directed DNA polymerase